MLIVLFAPPGPIDAWLAALRAALPGDTIVGSDAAFDPAEVADACRPNACAPFPTYD